MGMFARVVVALVAGGLVAGCSHKAEPVTAPAFDVVSSYGNKIPGKWLLYIDGSALDTTIHPTTYACSAHNYPLVASGSFANSIRQTLSNLIENVEQIPAPVPAQMVRARGARGLIVVRGSQIRGDVETKPGFWTASMATNVAIVASVAVDGVKGRLFGTTVDGTGKAHMDAGFACEGGGKSLAKSAGQGIHVVARKIGEAISNSDRVRNYKL